MTFHCVAETCRLSVVYGLGVATSSGGNLEEVKSIVIFYEYPGECASDWMHSAAQVPAQ